MKTTTVLVGVIGILVIACAGLALANWNLRYGEKERMAIPDIELTYQMEFIGSDRSFGLGHLTGFVWFANPEAQPKGARQYYTIEAGDTLDANLEQVYTVKSYLKLPPLAPRLLGEETLTVLENTSERITLADGGGNKIMIEKGTEKVTTLDAQGDAATVITNESEFRDRMYDFWDRNH